MEVTKKEVPGESKEVKRPEIDSAIIEELLKSYERPTDLTGPGGIIEELHKRLYERVLEAELTHYLGYGKGEATNAIESLHMQLRKVLKARGHFPSDEAATKLIYLVLRDITKKWTNPPITWKLAATQFAIRFGQRFFAVEI